MTCVKTGFHATLFDGTWVYGDAFRVEDVFIFRICAVSGTPTRLRKNYHISNYIHWFDERKTSRIVNSTLIADADMVGEFGYEGVPC